MSKIEELKAKMAAMKAATFTAAPKVTNSNSVSNQNAVQIPAKQPYSPKNQLAPDAPGFLLQSKVSELSAALLDRHPKMPTLLDEIFKTIKQYPEQVTILEEEAIAEIVSGLKQLTGVKFAEAATKSSGATKKLKNATVDMF